MPQGDVLSPYIFNICVEILLLKITKTNSLEGITIAKEEARAETYADDTIIMKREKPKNSDQNNPGLLEIIWTSRIPEKNQCHPNRRKL